MGLTHLSWAKENPIWSVP